MGESVDGRSGADPEADEASRGDGILVLEDGNGALVVGSEDALAAFVAQWRDEGREIAYERPVRRDDLDSAIRTAVDLGAIGANVAAAARYVKLQTAGHQGDTVVIRRWVQGADGKIVSNARISSATVAGLNPAVTLGIVGIRIALAEAKHEIIDAIEKVGAKADELLRRAEADRVGDVHGNHRALHRLVARLDDGGQLSDTDWSTVAGLGPTLEVGVERLRTYASRLIHDLPSGLKPADRAKRLSRLVEHDQLGAVLRLLIAAEQSLHLWQRLRIERVRIAEPHHLDEAIKSAHATLTEHLDADGELINELQRALQDYGLLRPMDFYRKFSGRRLHDNIEVLRTDVDYFLAARGLQADAWEHGRVPTTRDALRVVTSAAVQSGKSVGILGDKVIDSGLVGVSRAGSAIAAKADQLRRGQPRSERGPATEGSNDAKDPTSSEGQG